MAKFSTGLRTEVMGTSGVMSVINDNGMELRVYDGTPPISADAAAGGTLLLTVSAPAGLTVQPLAGSASLVRDPSQVWKDDSAAASGTMRYFRMCPSSDSGGESTSEPRIQGTIGDTPGHDMVVTSADIVANAEWVLNYFRLTLPTL